MVVDEQSSNHCGCLSVPTGHGETKPRLRRDRNGVRDCRKEMGNGKGGDREVKAVKSEGVTSSTGRHLSFTSALSVALCLTHTHKLLLPVEYTLQLAHCGDSFVLRACA